VSSPLESIRKPQYTGENRCLPCTAVNLIIAAVIALMVGVVSLPVGAGVFAASVAAIYLRGYLIPGTPALTKRYAPTWFLSLFGKTKRPVGTEGVERPGTDPTEESARADDSASAAESTPAVDPEALLVDAGVVEACADERDLCLVDEFVDEWRVAVDRLIDDPDAREATASALFERDAVRIDFDRNGRAVARVDDDSRDDWRLASWPTEGALLADLAAASVLADRVAAWPDVSPSQRAGIAKALRSFMPECPLCGGRVAMTEDTVESCCQSFDVIAVRCLDCSEHFLELDPERVGDAEAAA
jgi:hypothetical protein